MQLDRITIALRPRSPREAMDLGAKLLRANARAVWSAWFIATVPIFVLLNVAFGLLGKPWLAMLAMWWLKPAFDRLPLFVLSRALFGDTPDWRQTLRGQRAWRWVPTLAHLSLLRVDSTRALRLPLVFLEGLRGASARARWRVLRGPLVSQTSLLTYSCLQFELAFYVGFWALVAMLVPSELWPSSWAALAHLLAGTAFTRLTYASNGVAYLAMSAIEPLYVAAGFAMYINRRTQLECWDLDLTFRRLAARVAAAAVLVLACVAVTPSVVRAAERVAPKVTMGHVFQPVPAGERARLNAAAKVVASDPLLGHKVTRKEWQWRTPPKPEKAHVHVGQLSAGVQLFGGLVRLLLYALGAAALIALAVAVMRRVGAVRRARVPAAPLPDSVQVRSEALELPLPADLGGAVRELWQGGRPRAALALLYRGTAEAVFAAVQTDWPVAATEADCLRCARQLTVHAHGEQAQRIVRAWQAAAYADRLPDEAGIEALLAGWPLRRAEVDS